ncbi:MAG: ATP-binding protein, partial [Sphingomonadales bacterium]
MTTNPRRWRFFQSREFLPVKVAIIYAIISMAYIFGSDWIVEAGIGRGWQFAAQTYKGIAFVVVSAIIIALLIRRELRRYAQVEQAYARSQRMEAVGKLSSGIAHDFNNLLTVVAGNLELIEAEARQNPAITNRVATALLAADRGAELTRRLLAFSRHQIMEPSNVNVNETIRRMTRLLHSVLGEGIEVKEALASNLPLIRVDPRQLESAILNLAINSRDALPQGGQITLITEFAALDKPLSDTRWPVPAGRYVIVAVSDNGVGIPDSVQVRLFEPFFTTKPEGRGTGLGLSIIGNFIKEFDGHVTVTSTESHGTTVRLYFPEAAPPSAQDAAPAGQGAVVRGGDETILLVENDRGVKDV